MKRKSSPKSDPRRAELEDALQSSWSRENLAVYGDYLQSQGDPRGELIALDLGDTTSRSIFDRRAELVKRFLGRRLSSVPHGNVHYGFVTGLVVDEPRQAKHADVLARLLETDAGPFLRGITIKGSAEWIGKALALLAKQQRPWLDHLAVSMGSYYPSAAVKPELVEAVIAATPALRMLSLVFATPFTDFAHPNLATLRVSDYALRFLATAKSSLPITSLDLCVREMPLELATKLPALRSLDLSRSRVNAVRAVYDAFPLRSQLTHVVFPHNTKVDDIPTDAELAPPPASDALEGEILVDVPGLECQRIHILWLGHHLFNFELLAEPHQAAWLDFTRFLATLPHDDKLRPFPATTLLRALELVRLPDSRRQWPLIRDALLATSVESISIGRPSNGG